MTPEEIKIIIEKTISGSFKFYWINLLIAFLIGIVFILLLVSDQQRRGVWVL